MTVKFYGSSIVFFNNFEKVRRVSNVHLKHPKKCRGSPVVQNRVFVHLKLPKKYRGSLVVSRITYQFAYPSYILSI